MTIPSNLRAPILAVEFDSSRAFQGPALLAYQTLIIGGRTSAGTVLEKVITLVTSADQAGVAFGLGSQLHNMAQTWFANNKTTRLYMVALDDDGSGVPSTGTLTLSGSATADGVLYLYIAGKRITVAVANLDAASAVATAVEAAVGTGVNDAEYAVTAAAVGAVVTFTAKNDGEPGNDIDVRVNYNEGEELPAGIGAAIVAQASGASNPDLADIIALWGDEWYNLVVAPYTDATNLTAMETELADRFGPIRMIDGLYHTAMDDTLGNLSSFGAGRNSPHVVCQEATDVISTPYELAAAVAGQVGAEGAADPARPFQTLELKNIVPAPITERFTFLERNNTLLYDGIATINVDQAGKVRIERNITMYQKNAASADDIAYLNENTLLTLMFIRYDWRQHILTKYPRAKLADDGVRAAPGQSIMTPKVGKAEAMAKFRQWEHLGLVENFDQFKNDLVVTRSISDPDRMDWTLGPDLVNQFRVGGSTIQFLLQSPAV
jgi:phage tail sheath gpL-like